MPSLNRPNAPNRLPSADFEDLFCKPRALHASEARSSITTPSPLSSPANILTQRRAFRSSDTEIPTPSSPLALPLATSRPLVPPRRPQHAERPSYRTESSVKSGSLREVVKGPSYNRYVIKEEPIPLKKRTSSMSDQAREILGFSDVVHPSLFNNAEQVPHEAKAGYKWIREILGGWLEVRVGRRESDGGRSMADLEDMDPPLSTTATIPRRRSDTTTIVRSGSQDTNERLLPEPSEDFDIISTLGPQTEGLYCRTKRALGLKHGPAPPYAEPRSRTPTGAVLDRVTSTLRFLPSRTFSTSTSAASSVSNLSIAAPRKQRSSRRNVLYSSPSSVRDLLMGRPPVGTPEPEAMYTGSDSKTYLSVDMTQPDAPAFLPSEARRIHTPPLPSGGSGNRGSRGFFYDYNAPTKQSANGTPKPTQRPTKVNETAGGSADDHWYRVKLDTFDSGHALTCEDFLVSIPEHLPNSPLCPRNPKHNSGGTGTCPYHGRNKSTPSDVDLTPKRTGTLSPGSQTWWLQ